MIKTLGISLAVATILGMSGCGSSSSNDDGSTPPPSGGDATNNTTVSGKVADGYLDKAKVCLDKNENGKCDTDEPNTLSVNGNYDLNVTTADVGKYPILVEVTTSTIDLDDGNFITKPYTLTAPKDSTGFISPITTLIKNEIDKNPALTTEDASFIVSNELNITSDNTKLLTDYVVNEDSDTVSKQLHEIGKVIAKLIVDIEENIKTTLGITEISDEQRLGLNKIINDVVLDNISVISAKIKNDNKVLSDLTDDISTVATDNNITNEELATSIKDATLNTTSIQGTLVDIYGGQSAFDFEDHEQDYLRLRASIISSEGYKEIYVDVNKSTELANSTLTSESYWSIPIFEELDDGTIRIGDENSQSIITVSKLNLNDINYTFGEIITKLYRDRSHYEDDLKNQFPDLETKFSQEINFSNEDYLISSSYKVIKDIDHPEKVGSVGFSYKFNKSAMDKVLNILQN